MRRFSFVLGVLGVCASSFCHGNEKLETVLYLPFNKSENILKNISGDNKLSISSKNVQEKTDDSKLGNAALFNGKDSLIEIKSLNLKPNESFTIEFRVKAEPQKSAEAFPIILYGNKDLKWEISFFSRGRIGFFQKKNNKILQGTVMLSQMGRQEKWTHIAFVRDSKEGKIRFYQDGQMLYEKSEIPDSFSISPNETMYIGGENSKEGSKHFHGLLGKFVFYKGAKRIFDAENSGQNVSEYKPASPVLEKPDPMIAASWEVLKKYQLNIVPAPKDIKVTGEAMAISPDEWGLELKNDYLSPGIEFFNERMELAGGKALKENKNAQNRIIIGDFEKLKEYLPKIGNPEKPPRQGYVIGTFSEDGKKRFVIAGTDKEGSLYGCITLALALKKGEKNPFLYPITARDWPDFTYRMANFHILPGKFDFESTKKIIDRALALKFNMVQGSSLYTTIADMIKNSEKIKKYYDYANKRGIRMLIQNHTCVEEDIPKFDSKTVKGASHIYYPYKTEEGLLADSHYGPGRAFTWCRDDLIEKRGFQLNQLLNEINGNSVFLHSMDCGGVDNPGNWAKRTPMDIKRWGNDRAAAEANLYNIIYNNMIKNHPDLLCIIVEYPYGASYLKNQEIIEWLTRLNSLLNPDIYFCMRECSRENLEKWLAMTGKRPYIIGFEPYPVRHQQFFSCMPRYARTFYFKDREKDIYWMFSNSTLKRNLEPKALIQAEYAWNTEAPGWGWFPEDAKYITRIDEQVPQINEELLPRALSIFYGEKAAQYIAKALSTCISAGITTNQSAFQGASLSSYFNAKAKAGEEAVKDMEKAAPLVTGNEKNEFDFLYSLIKTAAILNKVKSMQLQARDDLANGKTEAAEQTIAEARKLLKNVKEPKWTSLLSKELDVAKNVGWFREKKKYLERIKKENIKVGVYNYGFHKGIVYSLDNAAGMKTGVFEDPQPAYLKNFDAVIFNACKDTGDVYGDWRKAVRDFAENGGVVIFTHNAIGRYPSSDFGKQIFPEICSGYAGQQINETELTVKKDIDEGFKAGDKYIHGYSDHLLPEPGKNAEILLVNKLGKAVAVGGKVGKGYVIYTGEIFGLSNESNDSDLTGDNWKMLFHMIRYAKKNCTKI